MNLINMRGLKENAISQSRGRAISMVLKHWKLFVACLSNFWLRKILLDSLKKKIFPAETKKMEGTNGPADGPS
jgi:hypothetical protein